MALELRQQLKLTQQLVMTPQLQMAIKLLQLSRLELMDTIRQELEENPALEDVGEAQGDESPGERQESDSLENRDDDAPKEITINEKIREDIDWSNYMDNYNSPGRVNFETEEREAPQYEAFVSKRESLSDHLLWQLLLTSPTEEEREIGCLVIGNLNRDGYLEVSPEELAETGGADPELIQKILGLLQTFDPIGVCARNLQESLLIQAEYYGCDEPRVVEIIQNHLVHLENRNYKAIAKALKTDIDQVVEAVNIIKRLEPRPGRQFTDEESHYINPDIYVYKVEDDFVIVMNDDGMPKLRVNSFYQNAIFKGDKVAGSAREYMQEKMRSAAWLIKSIQQRQKTIYKVVESILKFQRDFFEKGLAHLKPMVLRDVAEDIEMHESTISRVTTNKYVYTPQGIFELKYFFNSSINRVHGDAIASASVQEKIRQIIEHEDPKKPFSDDKISQMLKDANINIARRTVAKYREMMRILPSNKRKQY